MFSPSSTSGVTKPWIIATVCWFLAVGTFTWLNFRMGTSYTLCLFKNLTDHPCPGCGSTRATLALMSGQLGTAFSYNPLATTFLLLSPAILFGWIWNQKRNPPDRWRPGRYFWIITTGLVMANWWFVIKNLP